jgi:hypothetical protein
MLELLLNDSLFARLKYFFVNYYDLSNLHLILFFQNLLKIKLLCHEEKQMIDLNEVFYVF